MEFSSRHEIEDDMSHHVVLSNKVYCLGGKMVSGMRENAWNKEL